MRGVVIKLEKILIILFLFIKIIIPCPCFGETIVFLAICLKGNPVRAGSSTRYCEHLNKEGIFYLHATVVRREGFIPWVKLGNLPK